MARLLVAGWVWALLAALCVPVRGDETALPGAGRKVLAVELRTDLPAELVSSWDQLDVAVGSRLDTEAVRRLLLSIHGTGLASETEVHVRLERGGVVLVVAAWANRIVDTVRFEGEFGVREADLRALSRVRPRRPLRSRRLTRSVYDMIDHLEREGYLEAVVRARIGLDEATNTANVVFNVDAGRRYTVGGIDFGGDLGTLARAELLEKMESRPAGRYWPARAERDVDNLRRALIAAGHRTARVAPPEQLPDEEDATVDITYEIEAGPLIEVEIRGADRETLRREGLLPFLGEQGYDPALVRYSERRVRTWFQRRGHYHVKVESVEEVTEGVVRLTMTVVPGERFRLREIEFVGNDSVPGETLRRLMATSEPRAFDSDSGRLVSEVVAEDLTNLRSYYALQGFGSARIGPIEVEERGERLELTLPIVEGPMRRVGTVSWSGNHELSDRALAANLAIREGGPFHPSLLTRAVNEVRARYRDQGFDSALVSAEVAWDDRGEVADVSFELLEGSRTIVRRVIIRGQQITSPAFLERAIGLEPGEPVSRRRLLRIQRDLYSLGVFSRVDVSLAQGELLSGSRDVIVQLEEGERHRLSLGGGFDTEAGPRALAGYSFGNLGGRGMSLHLDTVYAAREELFRLLVSQPAVGGIGVPFQYSLFRTLEEERNVAQSFEGDFVTEQVGGQVEAGFRLGPFSLPVIYTYKLVDNNAPDELDEILFDRERAKVEISSLAAALQLDRRDSPINATRGRNSLLQVEYAFPLLDADEHFLKVFLQQTQYLDLGSGGVVGASLRLGGIESYRNVESETAGSEACVAERIPDFGVALSERFFAGGRSTHRAYDLDTLGLRGQTLFANRRENEETSVCEEVGSFTSGGNGLALVNLDYRYEVIDGIWAVAFYDSGNVWADWRDISLAQFKDGVGIGGLWESPIGPLRLEIGWKLDREPFEDPYQVYLSFGTAF